MPSYLRKATSMASNKPKSKPSGTDSVSKKQSFQEWAAAGGGVPLQYKGREHVWDRKVKQYAAGGDVHMQAGGISRLLKGASKATAAAEPTYKEISGMVAKMGEEGRSPILPVPNRWFLNPDKFPGQQKLVERVLDKTGKRREDFPSGAFIDPRTGEVLDSRIMNELGVVIDPKTNRPMMSAKGEAGIEQLDPKTGAFTKSNLVRKGLFKPEGGDPLLNDLNFLATIEKGDVGHKYGLATEYASPAELWNTGTGANPTLRPRSRGDLFGLGDVVGQVRVGRSEPHDVYEKLFVAPKGSDVQGVKLSKAAGGEVHMDKGGAAFGVFPQMKPRRANQDREAAKNVPVDLARGFVSGVLGAPGDIESFARLPYELITGKDSPTFLPTSEDIEKRLPFRSEAPVSRAASGAGQLAGGFYLGPGSPLRVAGALPGAIRHGATEFAKASAAAAPRVIKPKGGNWIAGSVEKALDPLKTRTIAGETPAQRIPKHEALLSDPSLNKDQIDRVLYQLDETKKEAAIDQWVDRNLGNYVKKEMATPEDPVRKLAEEGITHLPADAMNRGQWLSESMEAIRRSEGFPGAGMARTEAGRGWENLADESIQITAPIVANKEMLAANPWLSKLDPNQSVYRARQADVSELGFDHIMDVLRQDVASGRIRPEQLNKVSMEQAVRRTYDYDQELAAKMTASRAAQREGLPVYKEYPEGYRWVELNKPGSFASESEAMGHSVRGYEPPKGHPDWMEASGDSGSLGYGHGGWEAIKEGKAKVYSLVDPKGAPHATVEVGPTHRDRGFFGNQRPIGDDYYIQQNKYIAGQNDGTVSPKVTFAEWWRASQGIPEPESLAPRITQIKGKQNAAPKEDYLPYIQDFVKGGNWSDVGDARNAGLRRYSDVFNLNEQRAIEASGQPVPNNEWLTGEDIQRLHNAVAPEGKRLKYDARGNIIGSDEGLAHGGPVKMAGGGAAFGIYPKQRATPSSEETKKAVKQASQVGVDLLLPQDAVDVGMMLVPGGKIARKAGAALIAGGASTDTEAGVMKEVLKKLLKKEKVDHPLVFPRAEPKGKEDIRPIAQRMAEQMTGDFVRQNPKLTTNPAGKSRKQFEREQSIPLVTRNVVPERDVPPIDYENFKDYAMVGVPGDASLGGVAKRGSLTENTKPTVELTQVGDITPDQPVPLFGGPRFGNDEVFWASNADAATPVQNNVNALSELYDAPVLGKYIKMASDSANFALHNLDSLLAIQRPERLDRSKMEQLNELIRKGSPKYGDFPGFKGFEDPIDVLLQSQLNSKLRKHIAETLTKPTITDTLGLPNGLDVVAAITHPQLRNLETGVSGFSVGQMTPGAVLRRGESAHPTYDTDITGKLILQNKYPTPYEIAFPDTTAYARSQLTPGVQEFNMMKLLGPRERIDQQYIDEMKMYEELMKQYTGRKKGGAVSGLSTVNKLCGCHD